MRLVDRPGRAAKLFSPRLIFVASTLPAVFWREAECPVLSGIFPDGGHALVGGFAVRRFAVI
jgi:hypothetical protein